MVSVAEKSIESADRPYVGPIDVLMPSYNSIKYLGSALNSVRKALPDHRLIVVDRHGNDRTLDILKKHGAQVYFDDRSLGHARQLLFEKSTSRILLMYDSDVVIDQGKDGSSERSGYSAVDRKTASAWAPSPWCPASIPRSSWRSLSVSGGGFCHLWSAISS